MLQAGISKSRLMIALEPEAASLYCRYLPIKKGDEGNSLVSFQPGTKYIVLDAGGTVLQLTKYAFILKL